MMGGFWGMGSPLVVSYLAPLAGRGRILREAESPGEGYRSIVRSRFAEGAPHPDPLRASFARLDPAQERGEGERAHARSDTSPSGSPNSNVFSVIDTIV